MTLVYTTPSNYVGPLVSPALRALFQALEEVGFQVGCPPSKPGASVKDSQTLVVKFNGRKMGYFNSTVAKDGVMGLEFMKDGKRTGALSENEAPGIVSELRKKHGLKISDVVVQSGTGEKSRYRYVVLVAPEVALQVLKFEAAL